MTQAFELSKIHNLEQQLNTHISSFWQTGQFERFSGVNAVSIATARFIHPSAKQCIVISPGRAESYLKYQELIFDLFNNGFSVFVIDHRGQGLSQRIIGDPFKGYVEDFQYYVDDLKTFIDRTVLPHCQKPPLLLAHSMGGAIAIRLMQQFPQLIEAATLSSPMIAISSGGLPHWLAKGVITFGHKLNKLLKQEAWYFAGQGPYQPHSFEGNSLSHSLVRHKIFADLYQSTPELQLGGVTFQWLHRAIKVHSEIMRDITLLSTPLLFLQAGNETIVSNDAQNAFYQQLYQHNPEICATDSPVVIPGAKHELFFEQDSYRALALNHLLEWFSRFSN